jgi:4-aminobutyrate aminotransferase-like enzyme
MDAWHPGDHGTTYGGNAVACAAVSAVLDAIVDERLCERADRLGEETLARLRSWQEWEPRLHDVRGLGLMIGLEFRDPDGGPDGRLVKAIEDAALRRDLLVLSCGPHGSVIRLIPPVTIPEVELADGLDRLEAALEEMHQ